MWLTALGPDAEAMLEALVRVRARDDLWISAAHVHILLPVEDVTAVTLQSVDWEEKHIITIRESRSTETTSELYIWNTGLDLCAISTWFYP